MKLNEYQIAAYEFAEYQDKFYPVASLMIEAAELADLFAKPWLRGDSDGFDPDHKCVLGEAGDTLWQLCAILSDQGIPLEEVAAYNLQKLRRRKVNGTIKGSGGNR